jgi:4-hydroxy-3-methylbut-2-enyl diphosphate reductase
MKIILAEHFGICFGVRDAIAQAESLAREAPLTILGQLAHNPIVRQRLRSAGACEGSLDRFETARSARVLITAHGASDQRRNAWTSAGFDVRDGTCPLVRQAHSQLRLLVEAGFHPVVIGLKTHVEVRGLIEDFPESSVVNDFADIQTLPQHPRYGVISQTTQPVDHVRRLVDEIRRHRINAAIRFVDTVCRPTKDRQSALHKLIEIAPVIVVVGGKESNNTRQLVLTCRAAGRRAIHIERPEELEADQLKNVDVVGLTGGTSTLPETVEAVLRRLQKISFDQKQSTIEEHP